MAKKSREGEILGLFRTRESWLSRGMVSQTLEEIPYLHRGSPFDELELVSSTTELREGEDCFFLIERDWIESEGKSSEMPVCFLTVGIIQQFLEWITGKEYAVEEIECRAMGYPADVFKISKVPRTKES
ncbi:MAG: 4-vinyl reductase [Candidatus Methanofastidiosia archaeon]